MQENWILTMLSTFLPFSATRQFLFDLNFSWKCKFLLPKNKHNCECSLLVLFGLKWKGLNNLCLDGFNVTNIQLSC